MSKLYAGIPRTVRIVAVGVAQHITIWGNRRQDVFFSDEDRLRYLAWLCGYSRRFQFHVFAYCLMTNHVHIVGLQCLARVHVSQTSIPSSAGRSSGGDVLGNLCSEARKKGLCAAVAKVAVDLLPLDGAIALTADSRLVSVARDITGRLVITDSSQKSISLDEFKNSYTGLALLISKKPITLPKHDGSDLRCSWYQSDFGTVNSGDKVERTLKFRNVGNKDLMITSARPTCGCAVSSLSSNCIPPNESGEIKITLDTKGRQGHQEHKLYINSNDPIMPITQVRLVGMVISEKVALYPRNLDFGILRKDESICREVNVYDSGGYDLRVTKVLADSPYVNCSVISVGDKLSPRYLLLMSLSPDTAKGEFKSKVTITTTHPKEPVVEVPVTAMIRERIGAPCLQVMMTTARKGQGMSQEMTFFSSRTFPTKITRIDNHAPHLTAKVVPTKDPRECKVVLQLDKDTPVGQFTGDITLNTPDPHQPIIRLRICGRVSE